MQSCNLHLVPQLQHFDIAGDCVPPPPLFLGERFAWTLRPRPPRDEIQFLLRRGRGKCRNTSVRPGGRAAGNWGPHRLLWTLVEVDLRDVVIRVMLMRLECGT